jgi:hypothetical protein
MTWNNWRIPDNFDDDGLTQFESAQVRAMQQIVRDYETQGREYDSLIYWLANRIIPGEVDRRQTKNPFAFANLKPQEWRAFFENALTGVHLTNGLAPVSPNMRRLEEENQRLREQLAAQEAQYNELKAEQNRLQNAIIQQRRTDDDPDVQPGLEAPVSDIPAPEQRNSFSFAVSKMPPKQYAALFSGADQPKSRYRELITLTLLAGAGYSSEASLRWEIVQYCQRHASPQERKKGKIVKDPDSGSIKRIFFRLEGKNLLTRLAIDNGKNRIIINTLTDLGRTVVQEMGVPIVESEWERLMRLHGGERQQKHAAQVCLFAHYARKRGWTTQICPEVKPPADPDILIEKEGERIYVEVEAGSGSPKRRMKKWRNQRNLQGFVAICAPTESTRNMLVREARANSKKGVATDFMWLRAHKTEPELGIWPYTW